MIRLWFKDGTFMIVPTDEAHWYETQPDWDRSEDIMLGDEEEREYMREENGHLTDR